jgi:hypothetical protein
MPHRRRSTRTFNLRMRKEDMLAVNADGRGCSLAAHDPRRGSLGLRPRAAKKAIVSQFQKVNFTPNNALGNYIGGSNLLIN